METVKWDGISHEAEMRAALLGYIRDDEKEQALRMSYGDFADVIRINHRNNGRGWNGFYVFGTNSCVKVEIESLRIKYSLTWNKAAKAIHKWLNEKQEEKSTENEKTAIIDSPEYTKAVTLHRRIMANAQAAQESLYEVCKGLKEMRDGKLYKELGYSSFENYCEVETGIKKVQAYKYVAIAELDEDFVHSGERFGVQKLALLAKLDEPERAEIVQNTDLESTTVKQLKEEIAELKKRAENAELHEKILQESYKNIENQNSKHYKRTLELEKQNKTLSVKLDETNRDSIRVAKQRDEAYDTVQNLEKQIEELEQNPKQVAFEDTTKIQELENQIEQERQQHQAEIDRIKSEHSDTAEADKAVFHACFTNAAQLTKQLTEYAKSHKDDGNRMYYISMLKNIVLIINNEINNIRGE